MNSPSDPIAPDQSDASASDQAPDRLDVPAADKIREQPDVSACNRDSNRIHLPATVLLERRLVKRSFWSVPSWYLASVAVGNDLQARFKPGQLAYKTDDGDVFAWSGLTITLYRDACERYWHALIGDKPQVYVMCREVDNDEDAEDGASLDAIEPIHVTIDYDDASAYAETDQLVLSASIPPELYRYMEKFVLTHYQPKEFKKRKRRKWSEDDGRRNGPSAGPRHGPRTDPQTDLQSGPRNGERS